MQKKVKLSWAKVKEYVTSNCIVIIMMVIIFILTIIVGLGQQIITEQNIKIVAKKI